jgi:hypothetical protein
MKLENKITNLIGEIILDCAANSCSVILHPDEEFEDGTVGFFTTTENLEINVATKSLDWWEILVHEYCHFLQWREGLFMTGPAWKTCEYRDPWGVQEDRLEGRSVSQELLESAYRVILACEDDCMRRTLKFLHDHGLLKSKKDTIEYIKRSNLYLYLIKMEEELGKLEHENFYWNSFEVSRELPEEFIYDPEHPENFVVPEKVKELIIEKEKTCVYPYPLIRKM